MKSVEVTQRVLMEKFELLEPGSGVEDWVASLGVLFGLISI